MQIIKAKTAGFCYGVRRAMDLVYQLLEENEGGPIYAYGPIIHNEIVMQDLRDRGVQEVDTFEELQKITDGTVILRSHGVGPEVYDTLEENGVSILDTTCPFVRRIHQIVRERSAAGDIIVLIGDPAHPEVQGTCGWASGEIHVISGPEAANRFEISGKKRRVCLVSQTTFNFNKFQESVENIRKKGYDINALNTICNATKERQSEAYEIAKRVDVMIVIGDERSSNTRKLFEICSDACANTNFVQTLDDLDVNQLRSVETVGITAGASTPDNIIEEVQNHVGINF